MEKHENVTSFSSKDISEFCRQAKQPSPSNISLCFTSNVKKGLLMGVSDKKDGMLAYEITRSGNAFIESYKGAEKNAPSRKAASKKIKESPELEVLKISVDDLNLSKYIDIHSLDRTEDQALLILKIYSTEGGSSSLSPEEIVAILKNKFNIPANEVKFRTALSRSKPKVDTEKVGGKLKYKLMKPGEKYLTELADKIAP
ncbi:hypothetical protein LJR153_000705 [Paenibacillus sp. LjRoot153]|uniref:hypothetical protein n=1 Tax=Paenibacillus sp. LjRoot153 TaxID=3342270 RepID=UPI003ED078A0